MSLAGWVFVPLNVRQRTDTLAFRSYCGIMHHTVILAVGCDPVLSDTRSQLLRNAGYIVVSTISLRKAIACFLEGDFDLVLLCHSIPVQGRERMAQLMREHASRTPIVTVATSVGQCDPFADATIESDPENLIAGLREVLNEKEETAGYDKVLPENVPPARLPWRRSGT